MAICRSFGRIWIHRNDFHQHFNSKLVFSKKHRLGIPTSLSFNKLLVAGKMTKKLTIQITDCDILFIN